MSLKLYRSNRLETLAEKLCELLERLPRHPTERLTIVVPGSGMDQWLSMQLAAHFGVCANAHFPFPRNYFESLFAAVGLPATEGESAYHPRNLAWAIAAELESLLPQPAFEPVRCYLEQAEQAGLRSEPGKCSSAYMTLCRRLGELFDYYVVYRPEWIHQWAAGYVAPDDWQAILWRAVVRRLGERHFTACARQWVELLQSPGNANLPPVALVFGVTHLPPLYVSLFAALARRIDVHLFVPSPSPEYWAEIRSRRQYWREQLEHWGALEGSEDEFQAYEGNPLLASLGRVGREFQALVESSWDYEEVACYVPPAGESALQVLQADVFHLRSRPSPEAPALALSPTDRSIRVHSCHSPLRELEVLHDQLRSLLEEDPTLQPEDIVVLCPDLQTYGPLIDAVFGSDREAPHHIPYTVADRALRASDPAIDAFFTIIELLQGRVSASELLSLLGCEPVREHFGFTSLDLEMARRWLADVGVRWGIDGRHRQNFGYPNFEEHSWAFALRRLLLGVAMPPDPTRLFAGVSPYPEAEAEGAQFAGKLAELCERLFALRPVLQQTHRVQEWAKLLDRIRQDFIAETDAYAYAHRQLRDALSLLAKGASDGGFDGEVPLEAVMPWLLAALEERSSAFGFLRGGVNFCALRLARCIPARVVCLIGLHDASFPRSEPASPMNQAVQRRRLGDPDRREEDRFLFLQALLAARDHFFVTYAGRDIRNNSERPPAVVVEELFDAVDRTFVPPVPGSRARELLWVRHPLQPFSPQYFTGQPELVSFSATLCAGARQLFGPRHAPARPVVDLLPPPRECVVTVEQLASWVEHAPLAFLQQRLGVYLGAESEGPEDELPLDMDALATWKAGTQFLELRAKGVAPEGTYDVLRAMGSLPPGRLGRVLWERVCTMAESLWALVSPFAREQRLPPVDLDLPIGEWSVSGSLRRVWPKGQVIWTFSRLHANVMMRAWVSHLALCAARSRGDRQLPGSTFLIGRSQRDEPQLLEFTPCAEAMELLSDLVALYELGLRYPLPLVARPAAEFLERVAQGKPEAEARSRAEQALQGDWQQNVPERHKLAYLLLYRSMSPSLSDLEADLPATIPSFSVLAERVLRIMERYVCQAQEQANPAQEGRFDS